MPFDVFTEGEFVADFEDVHEAIAEAKETAHHRGVRADVFEGDRRHCWVDERRRVHYYEVGDRCRVHNGTRAWVSGTIEAIGLLYRVRLDTGEQLVRSPDEIASHDNEEVQA